MLYCIIIFSITFFRRHFNTLKISPSTYIRFNKIFFVSGHWKIHQGFERVHNGRQCQERPWFEAKGHDGELLLGRDLKVPLPPVRRPAGNRLEAVGLQHRGAPSPNVSRVEQFSLNRGQICFFLVKIRKRNLHKPAKSGHTKAEVIVWRC